MESIEKRGQGHQMALRGILFVRLVSRYGNDMDAGAISYSQCNVLPHLVFAISPSSSRIQSIARHHLAAVILSANESTRRLQMRTDMRIRNQ